VILSGRSGETRTGPIHLAEAKRYHCRQARVFDFSITEAIGSFIISVL
jgi:hypothetical protein